MKIAVCIHGQPRYFEKGYPFFREAFFGANVDYFIHSWYDEDAVGEELVPKSGKHSRGWKVQEDTELKLLKLFNPKRSIIEKPRKFVPRLDFSSNMLTKQKPEDFMSMMYSKKSVGLLLKGYVEKASVDYDWVVFSRTDVAILAPMLKELSEYSNEKVLTAHVPGSMWNVTHNNDAVIASNYETMIYWSTLYNLYEHYWLNEGVTFCPHIMQHHHISKKHVELRQILQPQGSSWAWIRANGLKTF